MDATPTGRHTLTSPQTLTTSAACSMKIWWPNLIFEITSPGTSARRRCCWAMSCCRRRLGKASSVHTNTAPGGPPCSQWPAHAPLLRCPVGLPSDPGWGWPAPASHLAAGTSPWGSAPGPSPVGSGWHSQGLCAFSNTPSCRHGCTHPRPHGVEVPGSQCQGSSHGSGLRGGNGLCCAWRSQSTKHLRYIAGA